MVPQATLLFQVGAQLNPDISSRADKCLAVSRAPSVSDSRQGVPEIVDTLRDGGITCTNDRSLDSAYLRFLFAGVGQPKLLQAGVPSQSDRASIQPTSGLSAPC